MKSRRLCAIIKQNNGETMVETLVSVLISALALLMLASAIGSSVNIVRSSKDYMEKYYSSESSMTELCNKTPTNDPTHVKTGTITVKTGTDPNVKDVNIVRDGETLKSEIGITIRLAPNSDIAYYEGT